jgi:hypothetical protein
MSNARQAHIPYMYCRQVFVDEKRVWASNRQSSQDFLGHGRVTIHLFNEPGIENIITTILSADIGLERIDA